MPVITDIAEQKRRKSRVSVYLDGEFWCGMSRHCQIELGLLVGEQLSEEGKLRAERHVVENEAVGYCVDRLSEAPRTRKQMADKLRGREYPEDVIELALLRCEELHLLNDRYFAETLAVNRRDGGYGRRRVADKLRESGIERELADEVLEEVFGEDDEAERASVALSVKFRGPLAPADERRALGYLLRRGFSSGAARAAVDGAERSDVEEEPGMEVDEAVALLQRKYPRLNPKDPKDARRAQGFLARRGCSFDVMREALGALRA